jgi:hypothetical protein
LLRKVVDKYPGKVAVIGVSFGKFSQDEQASWKQAKETINVDWVVGLDEDEKWTKRMFPGNTPRNTYVVIDKSGKRREEKLKSLEDISKIVARLVDGPKSP